MKTKTFFFAVIFITLTSWISTAYATHEHIYMDNITQVESWHYFCNVDSIIIHKKTNAMTTEFFKYVPTGTYYWDSDSVIITTAKMGEWIFSSEETGMFFLYVYILTSPPYTPTTMDNDTTFCQFDLTIDAQNAESGSTYLWDDNSTSRYRTVSTIGTYSVEITNVCGTTNASVNITANPNSANLGPDVTVCYGETVTLETGIANFGASIWSTGSYTYTIDVDTTGTYTVYVQDLNGCESRDTINIITTLQPRIEMCDVSYDTITNRNSINWFVLSSADIEYINIWVKNLLGVFEIIETVPYTDGNYIHWGSTPQAEFNEYYITGTNDCGEGPVGTINRSIWLTTMTNELQWQNYVGNFVPLYYLVFARFLDGTVEVIDTVPACSGPGCLNHSPILPNPQISKYFVGFQHDCLSLDKTNPGWVLSNYFIAIPDAIAEQEIKFSLSPNPASDEINIQISYPVSYPEFEVRIYDILGQVLLIKTNTKVLDIKDLPQGLYIVSVTADGKTTNQKIVKN